MSAHGISTHVRHGEKTNVAFFCQEASLARTNLHNVEQRGTALIFIHTPLKNQLAPPCQTCVFLPPSPPNFGRKKGVPHAFYKSGWVIGPTEGTNMAQMRNIA